MLVCGRLGGEGEDALVRENENGRRIAGSNGMGGVLSPWRAVKGLRSNGAPWELVFDECGASLPFPLRVELNIVRCRGYFKT